MNKIVSSVHQMLIRNLITFEFRCRKQDEVQFLVRIKNQNVFYLYVFVCVCVCVCQIHYKSTQQFCWLICFFTVIDVEADVSKFKLCCNCKFAWRLSISSPVVLALLSRCWRLIINIALTHTASSLAVASFSGHLHSCTNIELIRNPDTNYFFT